MTCPLCCGVLDLLEQAVKAGFRFTPTERAALLERSRKSAEESIEIMPARGYTQDAQGRWGYH
jgi:hypothetical protein